MICYYHNKDLDGFCSGAIMKMKYPFARMIGYDYGMPFEIIPGERIVMADVSLPMEKMRELAEASKTFTWIDHHASAIKDYNESGLKFHAVLQDGVAACELTWSHLTNLYMPKAVRLLGEYDTWRNQDKERWENEILPFQYGMRVICNSVETFPCELFLNDDLCDPIIQSGKAIITYQRLQNEMACRAAFEAEFMGLRAICLNTGIKNSMSFDPVWNEEKYDLMIAFSFDGKQWATSLYTTKDDVDCSALAKMMGGGGHKKAAGFKVNSFSEIFAR